MSGEAGRLAWRCRRGMKELDLVLTRFVSERWSGASVAQRAAFERILDLPDPLLAACLTGRERSPDAEVQQLLDQMR
jgi:antitoxin CptB